ncbi:hypothetical protein [Nocardioides cynanchi]|uniref:hypothetical protein n=1 Tax=Nocardioides cynanchi TaxID=2558918 RepID=UPI001247527B|nr:hypothetical protein [Nocardioides cynanchi]
MEPDPTLVETRRSLHGVAELVLAGPQHAAVDTVRLRVVPGGLATSRAEPQVSLVGSRVERGDAVARIDGSTPRDLAAALGLVATTLDHVYGDGSGVGVDETLQVDDDSVATLTRAWSIGNDALRLLDPSQEPVLWPEHFDVGISLGEVNYGVSPGDSTIPAPYAYVGPWTVPAADDFWDRPFGAARLISDLVDREAVHAFFEEARGRLG